MRILALLPMALALAAAPAAALAPGPLPYVCVPIYDFPDNGLAYCIDADGPDCLLLEYRTTFAGPIETCIVPYPL